MSLVPNTLIHMINFDTSQQQVLDLDPAKHARVLGAPGTGKTRLLVEAFAKHAETSQFSEGDLLVLAPNRLVAAELRTAIERRLGRAMGGTPVRTAPSLAFAFLQRRAALEGVVPPRLLTGTAHDEVIDTVLREVIASQSEQTLPFPPEVLLSEAFRSELRELGRVLDDFAIEPGDLAARVSREAMSAQVSASIFEQWSGALTLLEQVQQRLARDRSGEYTSSAMLRAACEVVRSEENLQLPSLVLVDDAGELGEGPLALLAALADRGASVWVFGDPDIATGAFHGERAKVLANLCTELNRRSEQNYSSSSQKSEQVVVLNAVHRHGPLVRDLVRSLSDRVGTAGVGQQRLAEAVADRASDTAETRSSAVEQVRFATATTLAEQAGIVAHRLRSAHLGLGGATPTPWSQMAVICRSRGDVKRVSRLLSGHQVPSNIAAGGIVLREHQLVRELTRLLQHVLGIAPLGSNGVLEILGGAVGGLDPIAMRRLRGALRLQEVQTAYAEGRAAVSTDDLVFEAFALPGDRPIIDQRGARRLRRLATLTAAAQAVHQAGGTPREVLWELWQGTGLAEELQTQALDSRSARSEDAHQALDAVVGLFFTLQRHEEQDSDLPIAQVLEELLSSSVPQDTLAAQSQREVVTVTTPQGVIGREFDIVCVLGLQDGAWPNLRARGSLLGVNALERWLRGEDAVRASRRDTMHDELRLMVHSVARARREVLVIAVANEDLYPSPFFALGHHYRVAHEMPSSRLTLRGVVAEMRRRLVHDPNDVEARESLIVLAREGIPGAHPDEWYGVIEPSSETPLADIDHDPDATVNVSPSQMERAEACPLDWIISKLSGGDSDFRADIGTLLHSAFETAVPGASADELFDTVKQHWASLRFEATWQSQRAQVEAEQMAAAIAEYLRRFERSERTLLANEASFEVPVDFARIRGVADRIEAVPLDGGGVEISVVDLKTGKRTPSAKELEQHAQLQSYQLGVLRGAFSDASGEKIDVASVGSAKLLYVHPGALSKTQQARGERYLEIEQGGLDERREAEFEQRVRDIARVMAAGKFAAEVEHHCTNTYSSSRACSIHIIQSVSHS